MASITIRNFDADLKARLRVRAAIHGRSVEDEARHTLRSALAAEPPGIGLVESIRARLEAAGDGVDLELPEREAMRDPVNLPR